MLEFVGHGRQEQATHAKAAESTERETVRNSMRCTTPVCSAIGMLWEAANGWQPEARVQGSAGSRITQHQPDVGIDLEKCNRQKKLSNF